MNSITSFRNNNFENHLKFIHHLIYIIFIIYKNVAQ